MYRVKWAIGSSPRTRGTDRFSHDPGPPDRFIPADAGNSRCRKWPSGSRPVHPRGRGEQLVTTVMNWIKDGSSPRTRGTATFRGRALCQPRFIPADAGNSGPRRTRQSPLTVHPRGRGDQYPRPAPGGIRYGSSPRTRGTEVCGQLFRDKLRFIPADAGNSTSPAPAVSTRTVHPRGRGEQQLKRSRLGRLGGSSPRTRGTGRQEAGAPVV